MLNIKATFTGSADLREDRLQFIDGLRGIAALVVAVGHIIGIVPPDHPAFDIFHADAEHRLMWPFLFGEEMVLLFIMLSGFALYWSEEQRVLGGRGATPLSVYGTRRAWRILPTYYVALALGLVVLAAGDFLLAPSHSLDTYAPVTAGGLLSHLSLVHNLAPGWTHQINPPLWSIAVEAQLYLLFPLFVVLARRLSPLAAAALLLVAVELTNAVTGVPLFMLAFWFIGGTLLAYVARRYQLPRLPLLSVAAVALVLGGTRLSIVASGSAAAKLVWMTGFGCLLLALVGLRPGGWNVPTWRYFVWLGHRSYSLYAIHFPLALLAWAGVGRLNIGHGAQVILMLALSVPATLAATQLCYLAVERPSLTRVKAAGRQRRQPAG